MNNSKETFDLWCVVELFGHAKIAGRCTEQNIAGTNMLRVDVPETDQNPAFTRLLGSSAIYAINPVDEVTARHIAGKLEVKPIQVWEVTEIIKKNSDKLLPAAGEPVAYNYSVIDRNNDDDELEEDDLPY